MVHEAHMKVAVIGGGSSYTPELVKGFLDRVETFPLGELWLVDIDPQRLDVVGGFAQRMVAAKVRRSQCIWPRTAARVWPAPATSPRNCASAAWPHGATTSTWASATA
jgi:hypothetical protein